MSTNSTNFFHLLNRFEYCLFDNNYVLIDDIRKILINHLKFIIKETPNLDDDDYFIEDEETNLRGFSFVDLEESIPDIMNSHYDKLEEILLNSHSNLYNYVNDLNSVSKYYSFNQEYDGNPFMCYVQTLAEIVLGIFQGHQEEYIFDIRKESIEKISNHYLNALYNPRTQLGLNKFDRDRKELFDEE